MQHTSAEVQHLGGGVHLRRKYAETLVLARRPQRVLRRMHVTIQCAAEARTLAHAAFVVHLLPLRASTQVAPTRNMFSACVALVNVQLCPCTSAAALAMSVCVCLCVCVFRRAFRRSSAEKCGGSFSQEERDAFGGESRRQRTDPMERDEQTSLSPNEGSQKGDPNKQVTKFMVRSPFSGSPFGGAVNAPGARNSGGERPAPPGAPSGAPPGR